MDQGLCPRLALGPILIRVGAATRIRARAMIRDRVGVKARVTVRVKGVASIPEACHILCDAAQGPSGGMPKHGIRFTCH